MNPAQQLEDLLELRSPPVALTFQDTPPADVPRTAAAEPSGCAYWKRAADGETFYTEASDHYGCPIGAYTHGVDLPPELAKELEGVVGKMIGVGYLRPEEVPAIPRRQGEFRVAVYGPLSGAPAEPDVVLVRGNARQIMLLAEAAQAAGVGAESPLMGRPTCAAVPEVLRTRRGAASLGCIGNRIYTGLADDELYFALPGKGLGAVVEKLATVVSANRELENYHRARACQR
jgi:uncharacterized protein (DUF169 family)